MVLSHPNELLFREKNDLCSAEQLAILIENRGNACALCIELNARCLIRKLKIIQFIIVFLFRFCEQFLKWSFASILH